MWTRKHLRALDHSHTRNSPNTAPLDSFPNGGCPRSTPTPSSHSPCAGSQPQGHLHWPEKTRGLSARSPARAARWGRGQAGQPPPPQQARRRDGLRDNGVWGTGWCRRERQSQQQGRSSGVNSPVPAQRCGVSRPSRGLAAQLQDGGLHHSGEVGSVAETSMERASGDCGGPTWQILLGPLRIAAIRAFHASPSPRGGCGVRSASCAPQGLGLHEGTVGADISGPHLGHHCTASMWTAPGPVGSERDSPCLWKGPESELGGSRATPVPLQRTVGRQSRWDRQGRGRR